MGQFVVNILTWNLQKKSSDGLKNALKDLVHENDINVIVLQETGVNVIGELKEHYDEIVYGQFSAKCTLRILVKKGVFEASEPYRGAYNKLLFIQLKETKSGTSFNIAGVHLHSKAGSAENKDIIRTHKNAIIAHKIKELESDEKFSTSDRTILVGDFNANPYDNDLLDFEVIPAIPHRELIRMLKDESSIFPESIKEIDYWYNPMWNFMGDHDAYNKEDRQERKTGSYFLSSDSWAKMWHLVDGFILRPSIMDSIDFASSGILTGTQSRNFIKPNRLKNKFGLIDELLSDHLPVKLSLSLN